MNSHTSHPVARLRAHLIQRTQETMGELPGHFESMGMEEKKRRSVTNIKITRNTIMRQNRAICFDDYSIGGPFYERHPINPFQGPRYQRGKQLYHPR